MRRLAPGCRRAMRTVAVFALLLAPALHSFGASSSVRVQLDASKAKPRAVESLTEEAILRDYRFAWASLAQALEFNTLDPLEGAFVGKAKEWLKKSILSQQHSGLRQQYIEQDHKVEVAFYASDGDVMELRDTAEYQLQISDGGKLIHSERVVLRYIVLMTPAADHWVIRQLQAVPQF